MTPIWVVVAIVVVLEGVLAVAEVVVLEGVVLLDDNYLGCSGSSRGSPFRRSSGAPSMTPSLVEVVVAVVLMETVSEVVVLPV